MEFLFPNIINKQYYLIHNVLLKHDLELLDINSKEYNKQLKKNRNTNKIIEDTSLIDINSDLHCYFKIIGNPDKTIEINNWKLYSLNTSLNIYGEYYGSKLFDIASKDIGMGYYLNVTYNLKKKMCCLTIQGGSNIYDRESNYKNLTFYNWTTDDIFCLYYFLDNLDKDNKFWFKWVLTENDRGPFF